MLRVLIGFHLLLLAVLSVSYGHMPHQWAQTARVHVVPGGQGDADYLADLLGCVLDRPMADGRSVQCVETYLYIGPRGHTDMALGQIVNVEVDGGYVAEVRARPTNIITTNGGRIGRAVLHDGVCHGTHVDDCVGLRAETIEFTNGWRLHAAGDRLELHAPDGSLRSVW